MESSLLRMYLVNASVNSKPEKIIEFFEKLGSELQNQPEWKDWFGELSSGFKIVFVLTLELIPISIAIHQEPWGEPQLYGLFHKAVAGYHADFAAQFISCHVPGINHMQCY